MDKAKDINLDRLTELFDLDQPTDFWFAEYCEIDEDGIRPKPVDQNVTELLFGDEWREFRTFRRDICLTLPCSFSEVIVWAELNGFVDYLPKSLFDYVQEDAAYEFQINLSEAATVEKVSESKDARPRKRKINLVRAIESAVKDLREELGKKPSIDELWRYFENDSDKTEFIEDYTDTHLIWRDTKGSLHDCLKKTVANHLSRIKD